MGLLVDGKWVDQWYDTATTKGRFVRSQSAFRNWVTPDGSAGPTGKGGFKAEAGRYHLTSILRHPTTVPGTLRELSGRGQGSKHVLPVRAF